MATTVLRDYLRLIDQLHGEGRYHEAAQHCRHILQQHPRHIPTYRALARNLLEQHLYSDALDIYYRVLSADPHDLNAYERLALIHREQGHYPQAIWHLERAFELAPYNSAIQQELRALYKRVHKVRLTDTVPPSRSALAYLYYRSDMVAMSVAELRAVRAVNGERVDLDVLLAEGLWRSGQRVEAAELCSQILEKLPNCIQANAILAEIWLQTGRVDEAHRLLQRLQDLLLLTKDEFDPETAVGAAFSVPGAPPIPEKIVVEALDVTKEAEDAADGGGDWLVEVGEEDEDEIYSWLHDLQLSLDETDLAESEAPAIEAAKPQTDWFKDKTPAASSFSADADWLTDLDDLPDQDELDAEPHDPLATEAPDFSAMTKKPATGTAEMPGWLLASDDEEHDISQLDADAAVEWLSLEELADEGVPQWLMAASQDTDLMGNASLEQEDRLPPDAQEDAFDWFAEGDMEETAVVPEAASPDQGAVDIAELTKSPDLVTGAFSESQDELPEWLHSSEMGDTLTAEEDEEDAFIDDFFGSLAGATVDDLLMVGDTEAAPDDRDLVDLEHLSSSPEIASDHVFAPDSDQAQKASAELPDWLFGVTLGDSDELTSPTGDFDLAELAKQPQMVGGDLPENALPDWLQSFTQDGGTAEELPELSMDALSVPDKDVKSKMGAEAEPFEEFLAATDAPSLPDKRKETSLLDWLKEEPAVAAGEREAVDMADKEEMAQPESELPAEDWVQGELEPAADWLQDLADVAGPGEISADAELAPAELPDWIQELSPTNKQDEAQQADAFLGDLFAADTDLQEPVSEVSDMLDWLQAETAVSEPQSLSVEPLLDDEDLDAGSADDLPGTGMLWLDALAEQVAMPESAAEFPPEAAQISEELSEADVAMDWLSEMATEPGDLLAPMPESTAETDEALDWLADLSSVDAAPEIPSAEVEDLAAEAEFIADDDVASWLSELATEAEYAAAEPAATEPEALDLAEDDAAADFFAGDEFATDEPAPADMAAEADQEELDWMGALAVEEYFAEEPEILPEDLELAELEMLLEENAADVAVVADQAAAEEETAVPAQMASMVHEADSWLGDLGVEEVESEADDLLGEILDEADADEWLGALADDFEEEEGEDILSFYAGQEQAIARLEEIGLEETAETGENGLDVSQEEAGEDVGAWLESLEAEGTADLPETLGEADESFTLLAEALEADDTFAAEDEEDVLAWLGDLAAETLGDLEPAAEAEEVALRVEAALEFPMDEEAGEEGDALAWLDDLAEGAAEAGIASAAEITEIGEMAFPEDALFPGDLLSQTVGPDKLDDTTAWLAELAAEQGLSLQDLEGAEIRESDSNAITEADEGAPEAVAQDEELPATEIVDAMAWLDRLAAEQGTPIEALPTVADRVLGEMTVESAQVPVASQEEEPETAVSPEIALVFPEDAMFPSDVGAPTDVPKEVEEAMDWLQDLMAEQGIELEVDEPVVVAAVEAEPAVDVDELALTLDWLEEIALADMVEIDTSVRTGAVDPAAVDLFAALDWVEQQLSAQALAAPEMGIDIDQIPEDPEQALAWLATLSDEAETHEAAVALPDETAVLPDEELAPQPTLPISFEEDLLAEIPEDPDAMTAWLEQLALDQEEAEMVEAPPSLDEESLAEFEFMPAEVPTDLRPEAMIEVEEEPAIVFPEDAMFPSSVGVPTDVPEELEDSMDWLKDLMAEQGLSMDDLVGEAEAAPGKAPSTALEFLPEVEAPAAEAPELMAEFAQEESPGWEPEIPGESLAELPIEEVPEYTELLAEIEIAQAPAYEPEALAEEEPELAGETELETAVSDTLDLDLEPPLADEKPDTGHVYWMDELPDQEEGPYLSADDEIGEKVDFADAADLAGLEAIAELQEEFDINAELAESWPEWLNTDKEDPSAMSEVAWLKSFTETSVSSWLAAEDEITGSSVIDELKFPETGPFASPAVESELPFDLDTSAFREEPSGAALDPEALQPARKAVAAGDLDRAIREYQDLLESEKGLGMIIADLETAVQQHPKHGPIRRLLGDAYMRNGQLQKAMDTYRQALDMM